MTEPRTSRWVAALTVFVALAVVWDVFARRPGRGTSARATGRTHSEARATASSDSARAPASAPVPPPPGPRRAPPAGAAIPATPIPSSDAGEPSHLELVARAETRRRIRASQGLTYLNEIVATSADSALHRWDNRIANPVRVWLRPGTAANYQPAFLDVVRAAFQRWEEAGVPVRFRFEADSTIAEVQLAWRVQFEIERSGQTDLGWNEHGQLQGGTITIATFDPKGRPMTPDDVRVVALHEVGHVIGLDHSPDSTDIMFPVTRVRDLSPRDIQTAHLLYQLAPGSLR